MISCHHVIMILVIFLPHHIAPNVQYFPGVLYGVRCRVLETDCSEGVQQQL